MNHTQLQAQHSTANMQKTKWWHSCLVCPSCGSANLQWTDGTIHCMGCGSDYGMKFGKPAFCEVNGPLDPERDKMAPKHTWTNWRHLNHQWYSRELAALPKNSRLVDIGSGAGWFRDLSLEFDTLAIDFIPFSYVHLLADITRRLPLGSDCADAVMLSNALEHVYNPSELLREIRRIVKPGGRLFLTVPFLVKVHQDPYDFFRYTPYALDRMLKEAGFGEIEITPLGNIGNILEIDRVVWVRCALGRMGKVRGLAARGLFKFMRLLEKSIEALIPSEQRKLVARGFDQGYACRAIVL